MGNYFDNIFDLMETPILIIDNEYTIKMYNNSAKTIIGGNLNLLNILNDVYKSIFVNGVANRFPFTLSEKRRLNTRLLNSSNNSYKLVAKPIDDKLFLIELIKAASLEKTSKILIKTNREFLRHSSILSDLIKMTKGEEDLDNLSASELIRTYEEQLKLQVSIDNAVNRIISPIVAGNLSMQEAAEMILSEITNIVECKQGQIIIKQDFGYKILERVGNTLAFDKPSEFDFFDSLVGKFGEAIFFNDFDSLKKAQDIEPIVDFTNTIENLMIVPLSVDNFSYGMILLINSIRPFNEMDRRISLRLGQLFSLSIQRSKFVSDLEEQANLDILTGCFNRRYGIQTLENIYVEAKENELSFSLIFFDVNNLKEVNDKLGHGYGDDLIKSFAGLLKKTVRGKDVVFRYGGDEFIVILPNIKMNVTNKILKRLNININKFNQSEKKKYIISASSGSVEYSADCQLSAMELIKVADAIMYENKKKFKEGIIT